MLTGLLNQRINGKKSISVQAEKTFECLRTSIDDDCLAKCLLRFIHPEQNQTMFIRYTKKNKK